MPLLEREREQALIEDAIGAAAAGEAVTVAIVGAPGMGKTALLRWAAGTAGEHGLRVLAGGGAELEGDLPFGVARTLLSSDAPIGDSYGVLHALHLELAEHAETGPVAVVVDDAHWADDPSLRWLAFSARRITGLPVAFVIASWPQAPGDPGPLGQLLREADRRLELAPLGDPAVAQLASGRFGAPIDPAFAATCGRLTAGNPLFTELLLAAAAEQGLDGGLRHAPALEGLCPPRLVDFVARRLMDLGEDARELAVAAAVLGPGPLRRSAALVGMAPRSAAAAADTLRTAGLLQAGRVIAFAHPITASVVLRALPASRRSELHAGAARLLDEEGADVEQVAAHLLEAEPGGDDSACVTLMDAAEHARRSGAPDLAVRLLRRAVAEPPSVEQRTAVAAELGRALLDVDPAEATIHLRRALADATDQEARGELAVELARAAFSAQDPAGAAETLARELATHPWKDDQRLRVEAELLGYEAFLDGAVEARRARLQRLGPGVRDDQGGAWAVLVHGAVEESRSGTVGRARELLARAWRDGGAVTADWTAEPMPVWLTYAFLYTGELDQALAVATRWRADALAAGAAVRVAYADAALSTVQFRRGEIAVAAAHGTAALELCEEAGPGLAAWWIALAASIQALTARGDLARAGALIRGAGLEGSAPDLLLQPSIRRARARWLQASGRADEALAELLASGAWFAERFDVCGASFWRTQAAELLARAGRAEQAARLADEAVERARAYGEPIALGTALRAAALAGPPDTRVATLEESADCLAPTPAHLEHALSLLELGGALRRTNQRTAARMRLRAALDLLVAGGAGLYAERARAELLAAGGRPRQERLCGPQSLTPAELRVARMAARGLSNPQIAAELWVTRKTVEKHVSAALGKLGIDRREALAAALADE